MTSPSVIQTSFHAGEWAPALNARVDLAKYRAGAALMRNFFVDYRGGASTRQGTKYIIQAYKSATAVRLIPFQASFTVNYILEFGNFYIRFINNGASILEATKAITAATQASPCVVTSNGHGYNVGDWVFITGVTGMTQLNNRYFQIVATTSNTFSLGHILDGSNVNSTAYTAYSASGTAGRVYTLPSPYAAADLALLKYAQNVNTLVLVHPSYAPYVLTLISSNNWTLTAITFGSTVSTPTGQSAATTLSSGSANYAYVVTAVDVNGQESGPSAAATLSSKQDITTTAGTNTISWSAVSGAASYNVYRAQLSYAGAVPAGASYGFQGFTTGTSFIDTNIKPDFSVTPPIAENPFLGAPVASATITAAGTYTTVPTATFAAPSSGSTATGQPFLSVTGTPTISISDSGKHVGDQIAFPNGVVLVVATVDGGGNILTFRPITFPGSAAGSITTAGASTPSNPVLSNDGRNSATMTWGVGGINMISQGSGYTSVPAITFSAGAATATAVLGTASAGNPSVAAYFQQRLVLAGQTGAPQTFYMSQPGSYYNYNISNPIQASDAITGSIVSGQLNSIKALINMPSGLIVFGDQQAWLVNGGTPGAAITPADATAQGQAYNGASDVPPIIVDYDILYIQSKGSIVRDLTFNFYFSIYTGTDITILSSHLFYGFTLNEWARAQEPFKTIWAVRSDGTLLSLTFIKEQEITGWAHHDTDGGSGLGAAAGSFKSVASVAEPVSFGTVDAVYTVVQRSINGNTVKYIERFAERIFSQGYKSSWSVDAGLQYSGSPATVFTGLDHLVGSTITGVADGAVIPPTVVTNTNGDGSVTLATPASLVTIGLAFTPQLQTLRLDTGEPTVQGKRKKITGVTTRVQSTLGLSIGKSFSTLVPMKDLVIGNVGSASNVVVSDLVTDDARTVIDPSWSVDGQYCIQQSNPYPATILGVIPEIQIGDTPK